MQKRMLQAATINFAISTGHNEQGIEHLGLQADSETVLLHVYKNMQKGNGNVREEGECTCCYSKSQKLGQRFTRSGVGSLLYKKKRFECIYTADWNVPI